MELPSGMIKGFDLNRYGGGETSEVLDLGSSCLWSERIGDHGDQFYNSEMKRGFGEAAYEQGNCVLSSSTPKTLPLLSLDQNQQPNEEVDQTDELDENSSTSNNYGEEDEVVGWPPIKSWREKLSTFVKVKMEGVVIARKVDLSLHNSYQELKDTLVDMFRRSGEENVEAYNLTYQDREGDWLLAGDVPWSCFIQSVQRLKLLRSVE
ncbi:auxin-responsive protein IAA28-like [Rhododendron vialii]|uniref:auxin-responsive protein IAA28-like n=1 Tax=Rhododendron vialii TaxID=182163 RepID=UPI00265D9A5B|nr:auxin-responsive protein IAA28-like [Rhododendron vialii]